MRIITLLLAALPAVALAQEAKPPGAGAAGRAPSPYSAEYTRCMDQSGGVTVEMLNCIDPEFRRQDARLNEAYRRTVAGLGPENKAALRDAQRAWIAYRDTTCAMPAKVAGGTLSVLMDADCRLTSTAERVKWLNDLGNL